MSVVMDFKAGVCNFCGTGCGHFLRTHENAITAVAPLRAHPVSKGKLCVRGWHVNELLNTNDWIEVPLIRENGQFREASYDEAIALVLGKLGACADPAREIGVIASPRSSNEEARLLFRLAREVFRTENIGVSAEAGHRHGIEALEEAFGVPGAVGELADLDRADYVLVVGGDLTRQNPIVGANVHAAALRGARVVTLSSSRTQMAKLSARHLQQKPGTKRLVIAAAAKALLAIRSAAPGFSTKGVEGAATLDALDHLAAPDIAAATGIPYEAIKDEAALLAAARSIVILFPSGISGLDRATLRSIANLAVLLGLPPRPDGSSVSLVPFAGLSNLQGNFDMLRAGAGQNGRTGRSALDLIADPASALKALLVVDHDDGIIRHKERIAALDFVAYVGGFKNPFMDLAHVVLPIALFFESDSTFTATDRRVQFSGLKTTPPARILTASQLYSRMAETAGKGWNLGSPAEIFRDIAANVPGYAGMSHEEIARGFGRRTAYPARSPRFLDNALLAPAGRTSAEYPLALMVGKAQHFWHQNNLMRKTHIPRREYDATLLLYPSGYIEISPEDAKKLEVRDKWMVKVVSAAGSMKIAVKISEDVQGGSAYIPYFINEMITDFLIGHDAEFTQGEESIVPVRIERI